MCGIKGVASTKAFSTQTVVLWMLALYFSIKNNTIAKKVLEKELVALKQVSQSLKVNDSVHEKTKRLFKNKYKKIIHIKNKRGCVGIHATYLAKIKEILMKETLVVVDGEEDLTAVPFIMALNKEEVLIYGIWDKGAIVVEGKRNNSKKLLKEMFPEIERYINQDK